MLLQKKQVHLAFLCWVGGCSKVSRLNIQMIVHSTPSLVC